MTSADSPCVGVCRMDSSAEFCLGCGRTLDEITAWPSLRRRERALLMQEIRLRLPARNATERNSEGDQ